MNDAHLKKARQKAFSLLARRAYSRNELRLRLIKIDADARLVEEVLGHMEHLKLLNDVEYAYNFGLYRVGREGWGPEKIRSALMHRGVSPKDITAALDLIKNETGEDFGLEEYLTRYFGKRGITCKPESIRSLTTHLRRRGFHLDSIHRVLNQMLTSDTTKHTPTTGD